MTLNMPSRSCDELTLAIGRRAVYLLWCEIRGGGEARHSGVPSAWIQPGSDCLGLAMSDVEDILCMEWLQHYFFRLQTEQLLNKESCKAVEKHWQRKVSGILESGNVLTQEDNLILIEAWDQYSSESNTVDSFSWRTVMGELIHYEWT